jgi:diguanylate cyclase
VSAAPVDRRPDGFARLLDRVLDVVGQLAPDSDSGQLDAFRERIQEHRQALGDERGRSDVASIADACVATCRTYLEGARIYHHEREKEFNEVIAILRDAAKITVGDSASFHAQLLESANRFTACAALDDIRDLRRRMGDEVGSLRRVVVEKQQRDEHAYNQLTSRVETLQKKLSDMEAEATMDPLTRVGNRRRFQLSLSRMVAQSQQTGAPLSLAMFDVDHFKNINDTHGHPIGDRVLLCVAQKLAKAVRNTDVVTRYGGEEFALLLSSVGAADVESRLKQLIVEIAGGAYEYEVMGRKEKVRFTVSGGLTDFIADEHEDDFVKRADEALYEAKRKGRNRLVCRKRSLINRVLSWG